MSRYEDTTASLQTLNTDLRAFVVLNKFICRRFISTDEALCLMEIRLRSDLHRIQRSIIDDAAHSDSNHPMKTLAIDSPH